MGLFLCCLQPLPVCNFGFRRRVGQRWLERLGDSLVFDFFFVERRFFVLFLWEVGIIQHSSGFVFLGSLNGASAAF